MPPFPERELRMLARDRQVDVVLLRATWPEPWEAVLRAAYGRPREVGRHARLAGTRHLAALARVSPMTHRIAVLAGDGVGPEVVDEARRCVDELELEIEWSDLDWGSDHWVEHGVMMPPDAVERLRAFDAILLGAVGRPDIPDHVTLWGLLLPIRQRLDLWANVRPVRLLEGVPCALAGRAPGDIDMVFVRENSEGEYSGVGGRAHQGHPGEVGIETAVFTRAGIERVVEHAFELAGERRGLVTSATKSNASRYGYVLWDEVAAEVAARHPDIRYEHVLVDALAARMVLRPDSLDVVVASNLFGDILTDLGAAIQGGMGMSASANLCPGGDVPGALRAGARLGARHRRPGHRESVRRRLERRADARSPRRGGRLGAPLRRARGRLPRGPAHARPRRQRRRRARSARRSAPASRRARSSSPSGRAAARAR